MVSFHRPVVITGNWKMYKTIQEAQSFVSQLIPVVEEDDVGVWLAVPFTAIYSLAQEVQKTPLMIGAQNMNDASEGAFTGEIAGKMLKEAGASFVLLGHSERRRLYHEDNAFINRKVKRALEAGLRPVLCVGETLQEYEAGETQHVIQTQLTECLKELAAEQLKSLVIAYEPVWAIGHGQSATPEIAQEVQSFCRQVMAEQFSSELAEQLVIQYGGSVNTSNAKELLSQPDIDGLLIGGASLSLESFIQIVNDSKSKIQSQG
ncbi:triosephosphate isomerase [Candidatus Protochlamydia naegleriophila]|uniref:Triosephosphate isomerase n=1 Tax=Candidatus Protochlamydia naegleriophila TaxID=389348 RepID=A0A0U5JFR1_9BACT|nr:triose-phosphate isomerase [Candidatus Protochlamydia naegleriophila]CUI16582.1 triosephosphate isomerase [Candidatus Protochlamydia naegleriophila]